MRHGLRIGVLLKRLRSLIQKHLAMGNPQNLFLSINGIFEQPKRSCIGLAATGRQHNQCAVILFPIDEVKIMHRCTLMLIRYAGICALLRQNLTAGFVLHLFSHIFPIFLQLYSYFSFSVHFR